MPALSRVLIGRRNALIRAFLAPSEDWIGQDASLCEGKLVADVTNDPIHRKYDTCISLLVALTRPLLRREHYISISIPVATWLVGWLSDTLIGRVQIMKISFTR
jgi:hypothetical protein